MNRRVAIEYYAPNFDTSAAKGHAVANASLLQALVRHAPGLELACLARDEPAGFYGLLERLGYRGAQRAAAPAGLERLDASIVLQPNLQLAPLAWLRRRFGQRRLSLCGLVHGLAGEATAHAAGLLSAPLQPWDAVISTSRASQGALLFALDAEAEYLRERFGATRLPRPYCPLIPLGIETASFRSAPADRARTRRELGIADDEIVLLSAARRSFHGKAHPAALYRAAEQASAGLAAPLRLIECGAPASEAIDRAHDNAAAALCPGIRRTSLPRRAPADLAALYAAADIIVALVDNFQETFGLAVVEAMAAGLPVVASDWNGLRDTVEDGITGFLIRTLQPPPLFGEDLAVRLALGLDSEDVFKGHGCQFVAVDVDQASAVLHRLASDAVLRRQMGEAGRARARALFDWRHIVPRYLDLWADLDRRRAVEEEIAPRRPGSQTHPAYPDPFAQFAGYASGALSLTSWVSAGGRDRGDLASVLASPTNAYVTPLLPDGGEMIALLDRVGGEPARADALLAPVEEGRRWLLFRALGFLAKHGFLRIVG